MDSREQGAGDQLKEFVPEGGVVCNFWIGEADKFSDPFAALACLITSFATARSHARHSIFERETSAVRILWFQEAGVIKFLTSGVAIAGLLGALHVVGTQAYVLSGASHPKGDRLDRFPIEASCGDWPYYHHACPRDLKDANRHRRKVRIISPRPITGRRHCSLSYEANQNSEARRHETVQSSPLIRLAQSVYCHARANAFKFGDYLMDISIIPTLSKERP
jgi:hypothetical protein